MFKELKSTGGIRERDRERERKKKLQVSEQTAWITAQIKGIKKNQELRRAKPQTKHKEPEHTHLKFLTLQHHRGLG